ncbi:hypothetical protein BEH94_05260 [Candidatus Altiarchaeales archaeon WOR_SM1_SCG]|nr:hypothetical protein BEH94_05260 [Candidatus Altiarchaeales archaeon WOR_SM1_SCG]
MGKFLHQRLHVHPVLIVIPQWFVLLFVAIMFVNLEKHVFPVQTIVPALVETTFVNLEKTAVHAWGTVYVLLANIVLLGVV